MSEGDIEVLDSVELITVRPEDARNFRIGMAIVWGVPRSRLRRWLSRNTRWWRPRFAVTAVDTDAGCIAYVLERWSWRRWRWERDE